jgi:hypothetical protein
MPVPFDPIELDELRKNSNSDYQRFIATIDDLWRRLSGLRKAALACPNPTHHLTAERPQDAQDQGPRE